MPNLTDIFQQVASLPNPTPGKKDKDAVREHVSTCLAAIEQLKPGTRADYLSRLGRRARRHYSTVHRVAGKYAAAVALRVTGQNENLIRDFHHDAYYAVFFIARWALVSVGGYDCSFHQEIDALVESEIPKRDAAKAAMAGQLVSKLSEWREERNLADYIMNPGRLNATPQIIGQKNQDLIALFGAWNIP